MKRPTLASALSRELSEEARTHTHTREGGYGAGGAPEGSGLYVTPTCLLGVQMRGLLVSARVLHARRGRGRVEVDLLGLQGAAGGDHRQAEGCQDGLVHHNTPIKLNTIRTETAHKGPLGQFPPVQPSTKDLTGQEPRGFW